MAAKKKICVREGCKRISFGRSNYCFEHQPVKTKETRKVVKKKTAARKAVKKKAAKK